MTSIAPPILPNRQALAAYFAASGFTVGAEIGVGDGVYAAQLLDANPALTLTLVDPWDDGGWNRRGQKSYERTVVALAPWWTRVAVLRMTSLEALAHVADGSLDFVFIDGCHEYDFVAADLDGWAPKVRPGGIVAGHDYYTVKNGPVKSGVVRAVDEYVAAHGIELQTTPWDRANAEKDSRQPCFWWRVTA